MFLHLILNCLLPAAIAPFAGKSYTRLDNGYWRLITIIGPVLGPIFGGLLGQFASFRWNFWVMMIFGGVCFVANLFVPETYAPT
jgi:MFS family permease